MVRNIEQINQKILSNSDGFISECENSYFSQIERIAELIRRNADKTPIILVSGPSGSGKTTTALSIEHILDNSSHETHTLSLDNYFRPITAQDKALLEQGNLDLESPARIDDALLNEQLEKMINCQPVELPRYDFTTADRVKSGITLTRKPDELVILEGIHSLNPEVIKIPDENTLKIYVSVRTRIQCDDTIIHPSYIRLLRRMIRDSLYRGRTIHETIKMFHSVEIGEEKYIMPYKYRANIDVDTFIPYESAVYKPVLYQKLIQNSEEESKLLLQFLSKVTDIDESAVPKNSLIREFIGNGHFEY